MDIEILKRINNSLMGREEIEFRIAREITISKNEAISLISEKLKVPSELIVVDKIIPEFGKRQSIVKAKIYSDNDKKSKFEILPRKLRREKNKNDAKK